jgi:thioredoxin reductase
VSNPLDRVVYISAVFRPQPNGTPAKKAARQDLAVDFPTAARENHPRTFLEPLSGVNQSFPDTIALAAQQKTLRGAAARQPLPKEASGKHLRVVHNEKIARVQLFGETTELRMVDGAAGARHDHEPRFSAMWRRLLRDQLIGKIETELGDVHISAVGHIMRVLLLQPVPYVYDTIIVGGGPAGLSAALMLGRCRRRVVLCDTGRPRNARARALHGYLTRDGVPPLDLLEMGRRELTQYGIETKRIAVTGINPSDNAFDVVLADDTRLRTLTVLLASGTCDDLPAIPGLPDCFGTSVHHCPYCDGWEVRDRQLVVIGQHAKGAGLALALKTWTDSVVLCSHGPAGLRRAQCEQLAAHGIEFDERRIVAVDHSDGRVRRLRFESGDERPCDAIFVASGQRQQSDLASQLGCTLTRQGLVKTDHLGQTCVPGLYVVGDASRDVQFAVVAAAEGAKAAVGINKALQAKAGLAVKKDP